MRTKKNFIFTIALSALLTLTYNSAYAANAGSLFADIHTMTISGTGAAAVEGCAEGGSPPCTGSTRARYTGQFTGSPFNQFNFLRGPSDLVGYLDFPTSGYDPV